MSLITLGINHKTAPLELRERLAFTPQTLPEALQSLKKLAHIEEASILSTCNRTELYCVTSEDNDRAIIQWFSHFHGLDEDQIKEHLYLHAHEETIRHAMEVASGLDSMVLGEPQIAGQMKDAYAMAKENGTIGLLLGKLYQRAFAVSKQVRTDTDIGSSPVSVAFAAVSLAKQIFGDLSQTTVLMVGAGETIELAARHLHSQGVNKIIIANRSVERAQKLADEFQGEAINLQSISEHLHRSDIVIASTASPLPIIGKGTVERALKKRKHEPIFMVDLAVPRDVEPEVNELDDVYLYSVDDLQSVIAENMENRMQAAEQAREIIDVQVSHFLDWQKSLGAVDIIAQVRQNTQDISSEVLNKAKKQLAAGQNAEEVLDFLANTLTNKFLHQPCTKLRQASQEERDDILKVAKDLFLSNDATDKPKKVD
ncbi:MAG: glutamyl-tRNA reductase [Gammaproteobacteria bacterium]|nr:glutamyl-tRNA reductase [Gammaproteobacteria bacterium]